MATTTRPYSIRNAAGDLVGIVEASNAPQALRHYARGTLSVDVATFTDGLLASQKGIDIQRAAVEVPE